MAKAKTKRRRKGEYGKGSVVKRERKRTNDFLFYVAYRPEPGAKQKWDGPFANEREAHARLDEINAAKREGREAELKGYPFPLYAKKWLDKKKDEIVTGNLRYSTWEGYSDYVNCHLIPFFRHDRLDQITKNDVQQLLTEKLLGLMQAPVGGDAQPGRPLKPQMVHHLFTTLKAILSDAVGDDLLARNPVLSVKAPKLQTEAPRALERDEFLSLIEQTPAQHQAMLMLLGATGLRFGEITAATLDNYDPKTRVLEINQTQRRKDPTSKTGSPKTRAGTRELHLSPELHEAIIVPHLAYLKEAGLLDKNHNPRRLLFPNSSGGYISGATFRTRVFRPALAEALIKEMSDEERDELVKAVETTGIEQFKLLCQLRASISDLSLDAALNARWHHIKEPEDPRKPWEFFYALPYQDPDATDASAPRWRVKRVPLQGEWGETLKAGWREARDRTDLIFHGRTTLQALYTKGTLDRSGELNAKRIKIATDQATKQLKVWSLATRLLFLESSSHRAVMDLTWDDLQKNKKLRYLGTDGTRQAEKLDEELYRDLVAHKEEQERKGLPNKHNLIFVGNRSMPLREDQCRSIIFEDAFKTAGLRLDRIHQLRHTFVSMAIEHGSVPIEEISKWVGHSRISVTLDTYTHLLQARKRKSADTFAFLRGKVTEAPQEDVDDDADQVEVELPNVVARD